MQQNSNPQPNYLANQQSINNQTPPAPNIGTQQNQTTNEDPNTFITTDFSPIGDLLKKTFEMFKEKLIGFVILGGMYFVFNIIIVAPLVAFIGYIFFKVFAVGNKFDINNMSNLNPNDFIVLLRTINLPRTILIFVLLVTLVSIAKMFVSYIYAATQIKYIHKGESNEFDHLIQLFKQEIKHAWPIFLAQLVFGFIIFGSVFFFVIPAFIFALAMVFFIYRIVLENSPSIKSLKESVTMVAQNKGPLFVRGIIALTIAFAVQAILGIFSSENSTVNTGFSFFKQLVNTVLGFFYICYGYIVYQETKRNTNFNLPTNWWDAIKYITIGGYVIMVLILVKLFN